jgi:hypothetical protein
VWRDAIIWCDRFEPSPRIDTDIVTAVSLELLRLGSQYRHYEQIANAIDVNPWEAFWSCQQLEQEGQAEVRNETYFRSVQSRKSL